MDKKDLKEIDKALESIIKKHGKDNIIDLVENPVIDKYPIESIAISDVLGGGIPKGRILEIFGQFSSSKSLLGVYFARNIQQLSNGYVIYVDYEYTFDPVFAKRIGLDISPDKFLLLQPDSIEQGFDMIESLLKTGKIAYVLVDSTNAMKSRSEAEAEVGSALMGISARVLGSCQRRILSILKEFGTTLVFISQMRDSLSPYTPQAIGVGKCTAFNSSIRLETKRIEYILDKDKQPIGMKLSIRCRKNKCGTPNKDAEIDIYFDGGIDLYKEVVDYAIIYDIIKKGGAWYTVPTVEDKIQSKDSVIEFLRKEENKELFLQIKSDTEKFLYNRVVSVVNETPQQTDNSEE